MKRYLVFFFALLFSTQGSADFKSCDLSLHKSAQYTGGKHPSHEYATSIGKVVVGGPGEKYPVDMDHLAVQRALGSCAPGILKCIRDSKTDLAVQVVISFKLTPIGEAASGSDFQIISKESKSQSYNRCLEKILAEAQFGLILKKSIQITVPLNIEILLQ